MKTGAFLCSCDGTCNVDLEEARDGVRGVDVVASSTLLCDDGLDAMRRVVGEYDLDQLVVTAPDPRCQRVFRGVVDEFGLHPDAVAFVDHRELAGWVHGESDATDKTARLVNATSAGLRHEAVARTVERASDDRVVVVGDADAAATLADDADVLLVADGGEFDEVDVDLDDVTVERGRVLDVAGQYGDFEVALEARVTDECVSCMKCVREGPDGRVTRYPVDVAPATDGGEWVEVCPTDAIDLDGVVRTLDADQVVHPAGDSPPGGKRGYHTGPVDAATVAAVERLLGGYEGFAPLDLEMDVCAAGEASTEGCTKCTDACPHGAVERPAADAVAFDEVACRDCGACTSACPTGAVQLREPSSERIAREVEALLTRENDEGWWLFGGDGGIETEVVAFLCTERAEDALRTYGRRAAGDPARGYPPVLPVRVNCADTVGEAHVLHALAAGADGVVLLGCGDACLHSGPDPKAALVDRLGRATRDLGLGERVAFLSPGRDSAGAFAAELSSFVDGLAPTPVPAGEHEATGTVDDGREAPPFASHAWTLESVRALLEHVEPEREVVRGLEDFGVMEVSDACTLTPTCSNLCPADAIRRTAEGDLQFNHERCVNCGLCEAGCPEAAIAMDGGLDLALLPERRGGDPWSTVHEGEMLACARCGEPFTSVGSAEKIRAEVGDRVEEMAPPDADASIFEYCGDCRSKLVYDWGPAGGDADRGPGAGRDDGPDASDMDDGPGARELGDGPGTSAVDDGPGGE